MLIGKFDLDRLIDAAFKGEFISESNMQILCDFVQKRYVFFEGLISS